ncbi:MAG TPA: HAMP domain-containing sensor histidine kinase [Acidimicrobiales bacterium]|nr:HAMP domain-containing sensor histidine kinase [Acidimicrobiales bacterium]
MTARLTSGGYRGPDRRSRSGGVPPCTAADLARPTAMVVAGALAPAALVYLSGTRLQSIGSLLQMLAGLAAVGAGITFLACWKVGGRAATAWMAMAFVVLGFLSVAHDRLALAGVGLPVGRDPFGPLIPCALAAAAVVGALRTAEVDAGLDPVRALALLVPAGLATIGLMGLLTGGHPASAWMMAASRGACGLVWLFLAAATVRARRRHIAIGSWLVGFLVIEAAIGGLAAATVAARWGPPLVSTASLVASALGLAAAAQDLRWTLRGQNRHSLALHRVVDELRDQLRRERAELDDQLHDLRNAVSGIRTADSTLRRYAGRLDEQTRAALADALTSELSRLQVLIEPGRTVRRDDFLLEEAILPVVAAARSAGTVVDLRLGDQAVRGDRESLAQAVQNVLTNARRYAPGAPVSIRAERTGGLVRIRITDHGPGVPAGERSAIFERGVRGAAGAGIDGSGLGLYLARRLMLEMGGGLNLAESDDPGACFVLELPAAGVPTLVGPGPGAPGRTAPGAAAPGGVPGVAAGPGAAGLGVAASRALAPGRNAPVSPARLDILA